MRSKSDKTADLGCRRFVKQTAAAGVLTVVAPYFSSTCGDLMRQ